MKKLFAVLPLIITILLCVSLFSGSVWAFFAEEPVKEDIRDTAGSMPLKDNSLFSVFAETTEKTETAEKTEEKETAKPVVATPSEALGKIKEQFLSPYKVGLNFNGVYVKNSTGLTVDLKKELATRPQIEIEKSGEPEVLIVHTHATESYMTEERGYYTAADKSRTTDNEYNVTKVGETFAQVLRSGGIEVVHDRTHHDNPEYNGSYSRAAKTINEYLKKYPSIKIVVDLHRDSISAGGNDRVKPTREINGKKAAQVMLVIGSQTGTVTGFPNWQQNFRLALRYQQTMETMYPGLARAMTFASRKYNMNLTKGSMILEVGTDSNTLEEACYSAELAGNALLSLLNTLK